jgi:hypothetical protein
MSLHSAREDSNADPQRMHADPRRQFIQRLPAKERHITAMRFAVSTDIAGPEPVDIVARVRHQALRSWIPRALTPEERARVERMLVAMAAYPDEALAFARWMVAWRAIPKAERRQPTGHLPPTAVQVDYARALGHVGAIPTRAEAGAIINKLKADRVRGRNGR